MSTINDIFNCLEPNQLRYNHSSLSNNSLLDSKFLEHKNLYKFNTDLSIWDIIYFIKNQLDNKTELEQQDQIKKNVSIMLDEFNKESNKEYIKKDIINSIKNNTNDCFISKLFLSNYYNSTIYFYYHDIDICIKFGDYENKYLIVITKNKAHFYYNLDDYQISIEDDKKIINYKELMQYKKYKIEELRNFCKKLNINLYNENEKKKIRKDLLEDVKDKIKYIQ